MRKKIFKPLLESIITIEEIEYFVEESGTDNLAVFGGKFVGGVHIQQIPDEIAPCIKYILDVRGVGGNYLEIGAAAGGMVYLANHFLKPDNIVLIDDNRHPKWVYRAEILKDIPRKEIIGSSLSPVVMKELSESGFKFDVVLLDGNHTYDGVRSDFFLVKQHINPGGFIIIHDSDCVDCLGVKKAIESILSESDPSIHLIDEYKTRKHKHQCGVVLFQIDGITSFKQEPIKEAEEEESIL